MDIIEKGFNDQYPSRSDIDLTGRPFCFEHLAFHCVQQFSIFTFSKLGIVTPKAATEGSSLWPVKLYYTVLLWDWQSNISSTVKLTQYLL